METTRHMFSTHYINHPIHRVDEESPFWELFARQAQDCGSIQASHHRLSQWICRVRIHSSSLSQGTIRKRPPSYQQQDRNGIFANVTSPSLPPTLTVCCITALLLISKLRSLKVRVYEVENSGYQYPIQKSKSLMPFLYIFPPLLFIFRSPLTIKRPESNTEIFFSLCFCKNIHYTYGLNIRTTIFPFVMMGLLFLLVTVLSCIMIMIVYTALIPILLSSFAGESTSNSSKAFIKSYMEYTWRDNYCLGLSHFFGIFKQPTDCCWLPRVRYDSCVGLCGWDTV